MHMTILRGHVSLANRSQLEQDYSKAMRHPPDGMLKSYLVHAADDNTLWQIITIWKSQDDYEQARKSGAAQVCMQMFCDAGSTPERANFHVEERYERVVE